MSKVNRDRSRFMGKFKFDCTTRHNTEVVQFLKDLRHQDPKALDDFIKSAIVAAYNVHQYHAMRGGRSYIPSSEDIKAYIPQDMSSGSVPVHQPFSNQSFVSESTNEGARSESHTEPDDDSSNLSTEETVIVDDAIGGLLRLDDDDDVP